MGIAVLNSDVNILLAGFLVEAGSAESSSSTSESEIESTDQSKGMPAKCKGFREEDVVIRWKEGSERGKT